MSDGTRFISFRLNSELYRKVEVRAAKACLSPGGLAREVLIEQLLRDESERHGCLAAFEEVRLLRAELALATEAILTVAGKGEAARERAAAWVRNNLNR